MSNLVFKNNSISLSGFESVHIHKSLFGVSGTFALAIDNFLNLNNPEITLNDRVKLEINDRKIIDGYIDEMPISFGENHDTLMIYGSDKTGDLIDCDYVENVNEWKGTTLQTILTGLCAPFGVSLVVHSTAQTEASSVIASYKTTEGVRVSDLISSLCNEYGILPFSDKNGNLTIAKPPIGKSTDPVVVGRNAKGGILRQSNQNRFSNYFVKGYGFSEDNKQLSDFIKCYGEFSDSIIGRKRTKFFFSDIFTNNEQCQKRAIHEARIRAGLSRILTYNVDSWTQSNGLPWEIGFSVYVKDKFTGTDTTKIILWIDYRYDEKGGGDFAEVTVGDPGMFTGKDSTSSINTKSKFG